MHTAFSSFESASNPFAQMLDPDRVLAAVHRSERLNALASHVFRPLAWLGGPGHDETHDADIDADVDIDD
jgi:hypothetical protein